MATIKTYPFQNSTILRIYSEREYINISPEYQRKGEIWTLQKKQLLIDSILNDYDIPKLYFHYYSPNQKEELSFSYDYGIIDGRQRLEAIWDFMDGKFAISEDFVYLADTSLNATNLTYKDLASSFPKLKIRFDSFTLPIILVETEDLELIEDMFSRLNEAVPLNAAEKRNAFGGIMARLIRNVADHNFFIKKIAFKNTRFQYREVAARLLFIVYSLKQNGKIVDTKKAFLDKFVFIFKENGKEELANLIYDEVVSILDVMDSLFVENDSLLKSQHIIVVYFLLSKKALENNSLNRMTRQNLISFYDELARNRGIAESDITEAKFEYLEFMRLSQQGTNDANSIKERTKILADYLGI